VVFLEKESKLKGQNPQTNRAESNDDKKQVMPTVTAGCKQELELAINNAELKCHRKHSEGYTRTIHWTHTLATLRSMIMKL
jgi:hypothetical protein